MKKIFTLALFAAAVTSLSAQSISDAYRFSDNSYIGTARSTAMGNAMTAVGGDLGSIGINPAGSAVAGYSQFTFTGGLEISNTAAQGTPLAGAVDPYSFQDLDKSRRTKFTLPNTGMVFNFKTGRKYGLKSLSFGLVGNSTANFLNHTYATGSNANTSVAGYLSDIATQAGFSSSVLNDRASYWLENGPTWGQIVGYRSGLISTYGGADNKYIGATEGPGGGSKYLLGVINQTYARLQTGNKYDMLFNVGANISDKFYIGANIGLVSVTYTYNDAIDEVPDNPSEFAQTFNTDSGPVVATFNGGGYSQFWKDSGSGIYAKIGFIAKPWKGLRIGAAIQTPTALSVSEKTWLSGYSDYSNTLFSSREESEVDNYGFRIKSPYRVNAGVAYAIPSIGLISVDYEMADYTTMAFRHDSDYYATDGEFSSINQDIRETMAAQHTLRIGAEVKPLPVLAVRAGYNLKTSPYKGIKANQRNVSFGLGYSSADSFFADIAVRANKMPSEYMMPYGDYGTVDDPLSPEIEVRQTLWDVLLTVGFRF